MKTNLNQAHDRVFRAAMKDLRVARDFLSHHLPKALKEQVDFSTLRLSFESFIDAELSEWVTDILYSATFKGNLQPVWFYILVEHQRKPDPLMAWRMLLYTCRAIETHLKQSEDKQLPLVLPLVFYNGEQVYPYKTDIFSLFGEQEALAREYMFTRFQLIDLNQIPDETLRTHRWSGVLEILMKHIGVRPIMKYLEAVSELVRYLAQEEEADDYLLAVIHYLIEKAHIIDSGLFYQWLKKHLSPHLENQAMTLAEQLRTEGRREGRMEGRTEGRREGYESGLISGEKKLIIRQLERRFGAIPAQYKRQIDHATDESLLQWGENILTAQTIEEVFAEE